MLLPWILLFSVKIRDLHFTKRIIHLKRLFPFSNMNIALLKLKSSQNEFARNLCCTTNVMSKNFSHSLSFLFMFTCLLYCVNSKRERFIAIAFWSKHICIYFYLPNMEFIATTARSLSDSGWEVTGTEVWEQGGSEEEEDTEEVVTLTEDRRVTQRDISSISET